LSLRGLAIGGRHGKSDGGGTACYKSRARHETSVFTQPKSLWV